jgi:hypothetical protein
LSNKVNSFLVELGLKGKLLKDIQTVVTNESELSDFQNFILENDGKFRGNLQLVHMYIMHLKQSIPSKEQFVSDCQEGNTQEAVENVLKTKMNTVLLNKVEQILENGLTLEFLYDKLVEYKMYNPFQAIKLIALHNYEVEKIS